jgi:hypothetical protein
VIKVEKNIYFQKRYKIENRELKNIANSFVHGYYGQFLYRNKINKRDFLLSASLPYELTDGDKKLLRYDRYDNIAEINYEIENNYVEFSGLNRDHVETIIEQEKNKKILKSEKLLFEISQNKFFQIPEAHVFYRPIIEIIQKIHDSGSMSIIDARSTSKLIKYGNFLNELNIIKIDRNDGHVDFNIGEQYKLIEKNPGNPIENIFNYVLKTGYEYLYGTIGIHSLSPYIKISNSLYYNIFQLKKNIKISKRELNQYYNNLYNKKMEDYKFNVYLDTLSNANILKTNKDVITGDDTITSELINNA